MQPPSTLAFKPREALHCILGKAAVGHHPDGRPYSTPLPKPNPPKFVTLVFGAGVTMGLAPKVKNVSWTELLQSLLHEIGKEVRARPVGDKAKEWLARTSLEHRLHSVRSMASGDSDAMVASTYLIDRMVRQIRGQSMYLWQHQLNDILVEVEQSILGAPAPTTPNPWWAALAAAGNCARAGKAYLVTTNFDHLIARLAGLPIYLRPQEHSVRTATMGAPDYPAMPHGLYIGTSECAEKDVWDCLRVNQVNTQQLPHPSLAQHYWASALAASLPPATPHYPSIYHVHGSRLVPPSLVFDPVSYAPLTGRSDPFNEPLESRIFGASAACPVVMFGCGGTLFDPNFSKYWEDEDVPRQHIYCFNKEDSIDDACRNFAIRSSKALPTMVSYADHEYAPALLSQLLAAL